jgi:ketosteroid isomerase-like protein
MTVQEAVDRYYDAWQNRAGDFGDVPLAEDFAFTGPVASFDSAEGYRAMARDAGRAVTSFVVRRQFVDGQSVCSIVDWEMAIPGVGRLSAAEVLEVANGEIVRGELFYDGEPLRRAMAQAGG